MTITGDVYSSSNLSNSGTINGDAFAGESITAGSITGQEYANLEESPIDSPDLVYSDFSSQYYYNGGGPYQVKILDVNEYDGWFPDPGGNNPACVYYCDGSLALKNNIAA